jgi:hypothetical protein
MQTLAAVFHGRKVKTYQYNPEPNPIVNFS